MSALATVPEPIVTVQYWALGCVRIVTVYVDPPRSPLAKVNAPSVVRGRLSPPLSCRTRPEPVSPDTLPPTVNGGFVHVTDTLVMSALMTVPLPFVTTQVWKAGWVSTVTAYLAPSAIG